MQSKINELQAKHGALTKRLEKLNEDGPEALIRLESEIARTRDEVNRWTGAVFFFQQIDSLSYVSIQMTEIFRNF